MKEKQGVSSPGEIGVVLDVTHAFRSLQFVILSVVNYLRAELKKNLENLVEQTLSKDC